MKVRNWISHMVGITTMGGISEKLNYLTLAVFLGSEIEIPNLAPIRDLRQERILLSRGDKPIKYEKSA